ncbi:MAG: M20 aminoacylase family protein [Stappiaceae bacterium]
MPIVNRFADLHEEITGWRRDIHQHPELLYDTVRTANVVAEHLTSFGLDEVITGIGRSGVVGVIKGRQTGSNRVIGLRADMDALPMQEQTGKPYASRTNGRMHACGHDGHTAMLLGTAKYLAETRNFDGTAVVIFQPAEEGGAGAKAMIDDGLMDRWQIDEVYGLHNMPGLAVGRFAIRSGSLMASTDDFTIDITGFGGHAAKPHQTVDPIVVGAQIVSALQTIVSRNVDPLDSLVISTTKFQAGSAYNVIPQTARLGGTVRTLKAKTRAYAQTKLIDTTTGIANAMGAEVNITYMPGYPTTVNHADQTEFAIRVAEQISGADDMITDTPPVMGGEDFSYMLEERPGAFIFAGNGDTANVHHPEYDFNDELIPFGCSYFVKLVENARPVREKQL